MKRHALNTSILLGLSLSPAIVLAATEPALTVTASTAIAYDSNTYQSPSADYDDPNLPPPTLVTPTVQSGLLTDLGLNAEYRLAGTRAEPATLSYDFKGRIYLDSALTNANEYMNTLRLGKLATTGKASSLDTGLSLHLSRQIYYDHDSGDNKLTSATATDISNRYNYNALAADASWTIKAHGIDYTVTGELESRNYEDPIVVSQYDQDRMLLTGKMEIPLNSSNKFKLGYSYHTIDYTSKQARTLTAVTTGAPNLSYTYEDLTGTLLLRQGQNTRYYFDYTHSDRSDGFVGYNDYAANEFKLRILTASAGIKTRLAVAVQDRDYPHALAFDKVGQANKTYSKTSVDLTFSDITLAGRPWWIDIGYDNQDTNDLRYNYDRYLATLGTDWEL
ncbi:MAG: hypothetical protein HY940_08185 [Gammaproteobacteria bacterium]|nr:hypothetical protein [Gammaproteobacteria bacterium]